jgi:toxin YoeB
MTEQPARALIFHPEFREDLAYWAEHNRKTAERALELVSAVVADPCAGLGRPQPLRFLLAACWSRRITQEHRLVYRVAPNRIDFLQARYWY